MRIDMSTREWHELIKPVLPHALTDADVPELGVVRIETSDRAVYAVATDRYTIAAERHPLGEIITPVTVHVRLAEAKASLVLFPYSKDYDPPLKIVIEKAPFPVTVVGARRSIDMLAVTLEAEDGTRLVMQDHRDPAGDPLAAWQKRLHKLLTRDHDHTAPALTLSAAYMARWAAACRKGERLSVFTGRDGDMPVLITVEDHFIGAWQPISYLTTPEAALADSPWHAELNGHPDA